MLCHWIKHRSIRQYFSCHWIVCHSIGPYFSCHWIGLHAIGSDFMPLGRTSCYWIGRHAIGSDFMLLDHIILLDRFHFIGALLSGQRFITINNIFQNAIQAQSSHGELSPGCKPVGFNSFHDSHKSGKVG